MHVNSSFFILILIIIGTKEYTGPKYRHYQDTEDRSPDADLVRRTVTFKGQVGAHGQDKSEQGDKMVYANVSQPEMLIVASNSGVFECFAALTFCSFVGYRTNQVDQ